MQQFGMANYTDRYEETKRVELDDGYWVDIRTKLTGTEMRKLEKIRVKRDVERVPQPGNRPDSYRDVVVGFDGDGYRYALAIASIVDWNLPGGDGGEKWPLSPATAKMASYDRLTEDDQSTIETACELVNEQPSEEDDAQFSAGGEGGVPAEKVETSPDHEVLEREEVLPEAGDPARSDADERAVVG